MYTHSSLVISIICGTGTFVSKRKCSSRLRPEAKWPATFHMRIWLYVGKLKLSCDVIVVSHVSHQVIVLSERISKNNHLIGELSKVITSHDSCQSPNMFIDYDFTQHVETQNKSIECHPSGKVFLWQFKILLSEIIVGEAIVRSPCRPFSAFRSDRAGAAASRTKVRPGGHTNHPPPPPRRFLKVH